MNFHGIRLRKSTYYFTSMSYKPIWHYLSTISDQNFDYLEFGFRMHSMKFDGIFRKPNHITSKSCLKWPYVYLIKIALKFLSIYLHETYILILSCDLDLWPKWPQKLMEWCGSRQPVDKMWLNSVQTISCGHSHAHVPSTLKTTYK